MSDYDLVWRRVDKVASRYRMLDPHGNIVPNTELRELFRGKLTALRRFYADNSLLTGKAFDDDGNRIDREYYTRDLTDKGIEFLRWNQVA